ncbi:MAG TPA: hypothetical protein PKW75_01755, partial [candidate division Zixibacteria bacterium]|nr:hypothetical protein [candidate division Zixibacteria bacterium]
AVVGDTLYAATPGGLLLIADSSSPGRAYLHADGLGTNDLEDVLVDDAGTVWLAGLGHLIRFDRPAPRQFLFVDRDGQAIRLQALADDGDRLWVGVHGGLVLFSKSDDGGQIEDSYPMFGTLTPSPAVVDVALVNDTLWLATSAGLAAAPAASPVLLKTPGTWTTFAAARYPELGRDSIATVEAFGGEIYAATSAGAFRLNRDGADTSFVPVALTAGRAVTDLVAEGDSLFIYHSGGLAVVTAGGAADLPRAGLSLPPTTGIGWEGLRWVGMRDSGLFVGAAGQYREYPHTGAPGNDVRTILFGPEGRITAGFGDKIFAQYDGDRWMRRIFYRRGDGTMDLLADGRGDIWAASWGGGLFRIRGDSITQYTDSNSTVVGVVAGDPLEYTVVRSLATDGVNIFASLFQAYNKDVVAWAPLDRVHDEAAWGALGVPEGLANEYVTALAYADGELAVGTMARGVYLCRLGSAPYRGTAITVRHFTDDNSRLISNAIRTVAYAPNGEAWIGTNLGISRWDSGIERLVDVVLPVGVGTDVAAIVFDGRGNAWVGTRGGLVRLDATGGAPDIFTAATSDLVSDEIRDLALDRRSGDLYIATAGGVSVLRTPIENFVETVGDSVVPIPNPFVIRSAADRLRFNLDRPATVSIYTAAGERVAEFPVNEPWDGRNDRGRAVASGAYVYVITDETGASHRGKILLVRKE